MRKFVTVVFFLILSINCYAQTEVSGVINAQIWTAENSPYKVVGNIQVVDLEIRSGVTVLVDGNYLFEVTGVLKAFGSAQDSIIFTKSESASGWQGIYFNISSGSELRFCRIDKATKCGITIYRSFCQIKNCLIARNSASATHGGAIYVNNNSSVFINNCVITKNNASHNGGVYAGPDCAVYLMNCIISDNSGSYSDNAGGLSSYNAIMEVTNCVVAFNQGCGIRAIGGTVRIRNSIVYSNQSYEIYAGSVSVNYSDVQGGISGQGNIDVIPLFYDNKKCTLFANSPCIDAGDPDSSYNDTSFPPSQGTVRNDMGAYGGPGAKDWLGISEAKLSVNPGLINFGNVPDGENKTEMLLISNTGTANLNISSIVLSGDQSASFVLDTSPFTLMPNSSKVLDITFAPASNNRCIGTLKIESNAGNSEVWLVANESMPYHSHEPHFLSIKDIPNDQGKQVLLTWSRSDLDRVVSDTAITMYGIWRQDNASAFSLDPENGNYTPVESRKNLAKQPVIHAKDSNEMMSAVRTISPGTVFSLESFSDNTKPEAIASGSANWTFIGSVPALQSEHYSSVAPTLFDSTNSGIVWSTFYVTAHTANPHLWFASNPDSGYSVDNLSPTPPNGLAALFSVNGIELNWDALEEADLKYYSVYRSHTSYFNLTEPLAYTIEPFFLDNSIEEEKSYYYKITATDFNGNVSAPSEEVSVFTTDVNRINPQIPIEFDLKQNFPNPFNPSTTISFQLPEECHVDLSIYNTSGQLLENLVSENKAPGEYIVSWKSKNLSSGIYFYKLVAGDFISTKKMLIIK